jgi:hypothetical protein
MTQDHVDPVSEALQARCGVSTTAILADGKAIEIHNIAWARDMGELTDHITTNISPSPDCPHTVDFFTTDRVLSLVAPESGAVLYCRPADEA